MSYTKHSLGSDPEVNLSQLTLIFGPIDVRQMVIAESEGHNSHNLSTPHIPFHFSEQISENHTFNPFKLTKGKDEVFIRNRI